MVTEKEFSNFVFDYSSVFQYDNPELKMKPFNRSRYKSPFTYQAIPIQDDDSDPCVNETWPLVLVRKIVTYLTYILVICLFPISLWICVKKVHALERIVLMRLGKLQPIRGPGIAFVLPCIDKWTRVDLRSKMFTIATSQLLTSDGGVVEAETEVEYCVSDVIHYVTRLQNQENSLKELSLRCITNLVSQKDQEDLEHNRELINFALKDELNNTSMNWGLEILNVFICSIKIIKAAEPVDALGTLMSALKAAVGQPSEHTVASFPFVTSFPEHNLQPKSERSSSDTSNGANQNVDVANAIKHLAETALAKDGMGDLKATFKLEIIGISKKTIYCCFDNGCVSVSEDLSESIEPDVNLMLTEDNFNEFLTTKISPLQAYMDGKIMVTGDWSLLRSFAKVFQ